MKFTHLLPFILFFATLPICTSCMKDKDLYEGEDNQNQISYSDYIYPFKSEVQHVKAEIIIKSDQAISLDEVSSEIPHLKYNKSLLFMLTQDDCKHAAYSWTWAVINGKPLSNNYYYDAAQLHNQDLPPDSYYMNKTLGSTDGSGNEVRFHFTTTLAPEWEWMDTKTVVKKGYKKDYYRFIMKSSLVWDNVKEIVNYGNGIAFHDVNIEDTDNPTAIQQHYGIAQDIILDKLDGRGCKMLAEPNGNKNYITAAKAYAPIQTMAAQSGGISIQPFQLTQDLEKEVLNRGFYNTDDVKEEIKKQKERKNEDRYAVHLGVHGTDDSWAKMLLWLNDTYGKDGDDSAWMPSQEEYYEYNYYRVHGSVSVELIDKYTLKLTVELPGKQYFYYPSVTVNIKGISPTQVTSISSNDVVTGLSYGAHEDHLMLNINCRKYLYEHAAHFVERYENHSTNSSTKEDAVYFVNMLKESSEKTALLERLK